MIAGINKIWYQLYTNISSKGFCINQTRKGLTFSLSWRPLLFTRDTASFYSENNGVAYQNTIRYSHLTPSAIDIDFAKKLHGKRVIVALELNDGSTVVVGVENPLRINFKYMSGKNAFDAIGYSIEMSATSRISFEYFELLQLFYPKFGLLYNYYAIQDENICNYGWRVPTSEDFQELINYLGGEIDAGNSIVEPSTEYWNNVYSATNSAKFNARGSGWADNDFYGLKETALLATISDGFFNKTSYFIKEVDSSFKIFSDFRQELQHYAGRSVRLIKNQTILQNGQSSIYTGNDGKRYRTICIGTQEWLADNLAETKYRTGNAIQLISNIEQWTSLTTGACCAYNNDPANI